MEHLWAAVDRGLQEDLLLVTDPIQGLQVLARLLLAILLGSIIGYQRGRHGKAAGLRTHMLVTLGAALFMLTGQLSGATPADMSRVIQGVATGIGFIGAGTILKLSEARKIEGVTTAASVWLATAVGIAVGLGQHILAVLGTVLAFIVLIRFKTDVPRSTARSEGSPREPATAPPPPPDPRKINP